MRKKTLKPSSETKKSRAVRQMAKGSTRPRVISFFCGGGGLDLGFHLAGFDVVYATDVEPVFCRTIEANKPTYVSREAVVEPRNITSIKPSELPTGIDFVIGGPPCQTFSASGRRAGGAAGQLDARGTLFEAYSRLIDTVRPRGFLFENVRGILGTNQGKDWQEIRNRFSTIGYEISFTLLDACDYGVPQHRERLILVGHQPGVDFRFPAPTFGPDSADKTPYRSPSEVFSGLREDEDEDLDALVLRSGKYAPLLKKVPPGGNYLFFTARRGHPNPIFAYRSRFSDFLYKASPDYPIKTLIASPGKYTGPFHWENRCFSIGEYKRLQGFPDDYRFVGGRADIVRQIGNSVSPLMAKALAEAIGQQLLGLPADIALLPTGAVLSFDRRKSGAAQKTRQHHSAVAKEKRDTARHQITLASYVESIPPGAQPGQAPNVVARARGKRVTLTVDAGGTRRVVDMQLRVLPPFSSTLFDDPRACDAIVNVSLRGDGPGGIQTMWNAVDDLIIRSSSFHSLFELYGHFTEPHPVFEISRFITYSKHPIVQFAKHISVFENCSKHFPRTHLLDMFGAAFKTRSFPELARLLRSYRFDIRCKETNIAMPNDVYMVAYPFTLPYRRQMNFSVAVRRRPAEGIGRRHS